MDEIKEIVYEIRCPICGEIFNYKITAVKFDEQYPLGYVECPKCNEHIQHTLAYIKEEQE